MLAELARTLDRVVGDAHLLRTVWGSAQEAHVEYPRIVVRALRQKLEPVPARPQLILNEPVIGYRLVAS